MLDQLMSALGYVGDSLAKPGRAVRGVLGGRPEEALAAIPFSDTLGITNQDNAVSGRDLLRSLGVDAGDGIGGAIAGMGVEAATDPLTYLGAGLGRYIGKAADAAQVARGPRYATTGDDLTRMLGDYQRSAGLNESTAIAGRRVQNIRDFPDAQRLLSEIPPESSIIGAGAEGIAFKTPADDVLRIGRQLDNAALGRPISPDVLQASRAVDVGAGPRQFRVERSPLAQMLPDDAAFKAQEPILKSRLSSQGLGFGDDHMGNLGMVGGRPMVIDPGAVDVTKAFSGGFQPVAAAADPGLGMSALLSALGGDDALRSALASGRGSPGFSNRLPVYGALGGASAGRFGGG